MSTKHGWVLAALLGACGSEAATEAANAATEEATNAATAATNEVANAAARGLGADTPPVPPPMPSAEATPTATVGEPAPSFELTDQAGQTHRLADYRGKVVVLEWINPQCPYVQRHYQAQTMTSLVRDFPSEGVVWLAVDSSHFVQPAESEAWRQQHGMTYPILQDASGATGRAYGATTTPNMYVIDGQGVLRYRGAIDDDPRGRNETPHNYVREAV
ncbi:MAG: redoxin domain-containing protein, partial [Myxococcales bacterium]|nr:redoxin domain-containing protein [Myxococcales bacterium]